MKGHRILYSTEKRKKVKMKKRRRKEEIREFALERMVKEPDILISDRYSDFFECFQFLKTFSCPSDEIICHYLKELVVDLDAKRKCNLCIYVTPRMENKRRHMSFTHQGVHWPCNLCKYRAHVKGFLMQHKRGVHERSKFHCNLYSYSVSPNEKLKKHVEIKCRKYQYLVYLVQNQHSGMMGLKKGSSNRIISFISHPTEVNEVKEYESISNVIQMKCENCYFIRKGKSSLKDHRYKEHDGIRFLCEWSGYDTGQKDNLKSHMRLEKIFECCKLEPETGGERKKENVNYCSICSCLISKSGELIRHAETGHAETGHAKTGHARTDHPDSCGKVFYKETDCGKSFRRPYGSEFVIMDDASHRIQGVKCDQCSIEFDTVENLDKHLDVSHRKHQRGSNPLNNIVLVGSKENEVNPLESLKNLRQNRSDNIKQYNCFSCDHQATSTKRLFLHLTRNQGHFTKNDVSEKCYTCDNTFADFGQLMRHRKSSLPLSVNPCRHFAEGNCRHGENCWYIHAPDKVDLKLDYEREDMIDMQSENKQSFQIEMRLSSAVDEYGRNDYLSPVKIRSETAEYIKDIKFDNTEANVFESLCLFLKSFSSKGILDRHCVYPRLLMDLSDFSLVLRMLSYVLRMCGMLRYKGIDMGYSLETNKEDSFFNIAKTDKTRVESKELKYLMKAGCGVHFFVCLIAEVKSMFISPHAISLTINSVLLRKLFDFCHAQKREISPFAIVKG